MTYREALEEIAAKNNGILRPADVVNEARNPENILHRAFEWDDTVAAEAYRLEQAKELIRVQVVVIGDNPEPVRAFVNLGCYRGTDDGGYRLTARVLNDSELLAELMKDAAMELVTFERKYSRITELSGVFKAAARFRESLTPESKPQHVRVVTVTPGRSARPAL